MRFDCARAGEIVLLLVLHGIAGSHGLSAQQAAGPDVVGDPFARYTTPGQCEQAAIRLYHAYWRDKRRDTVRYAPATDSVPAPVVAAARTCVARFAVASVPERELLNLAQVYLWAGKDTLARQATDRLTAAESNAGANRYGWILFQFVRSLRHAQPAQLSAARQYLARLDTLGAPAALWRLLAHADAAEYAISVNDITTAIVEARAALSASRLMSSDNRIDWVQEILGAYNGLTEPIAVQRNGAAALALLDSAKADLLPLRPPGTTDQASLAHQIDIERRPYMFLGTTDLPPIQASAWYGAQDHVTYPRRGVLSLIVFVNPSCGGGCYRMYAALRRLHAKYLSVGLEILLLTATQGYFRNQPMPSPSEEMDTTGHYLRQFLGLPATVAAEVTTFSHLADGRRNNDGTANQRAYSHGRNAMLVGPDGVVRWVDDLSPEREAVWNAVIERVLKESRSLLAK